MARRLILLTIAAVSMASAASAWAGGDGRVDVVVVRGNLDARAIGFVTNAIANSDATLVVLQIDVSNVLHDSFEELVDLVADPPVPLAVWVGPAPGGARGGAAVLLAAAPIRGAAPGTRLGPAAPMISGQPADTEAVAALAPDFPDSVLTETLTVGSALVPGLVDVVEPSIGQFITGLHGTEIVVRGETVVLDTARTEIVDGVESVTPAHTVRFIEPGLIDRVLSIGTQPATVFLLLVLGLALVAFEFYAAGPGIAAGVAAVMLLLAGYGLTVLPVWLPSVAAVVAGVVLYVIEFQRNDLGWKSILGTTLLVFAGLRFVPSEGLALSWWVVALVVAAAALFFSVALTTVARTRFATQTIGREHLVGRLGTADGPISTDGFVSLEGARWKARATRAAGIGAGDPVQVTAVEGVTLHVAPVDSPPAVPPESDDLN